MTANEQANPELLWSLRGGGGVGIVTRFAFRGQPMDPAVVAGPLFRGPDEREDAMRRFLACAAEAPETLTCMLKLGAAPPAPFLPAQMHAKPVAITIACHSGDPQRVGDDLLALRCDVEPAADLIERRPFVEFQRMFDAGEPKGRRNYWKSEYVSDVDDAIAEILLDATAVLPSPSSNIKVFQLGGAVSRVEPEATAAAHRDARFIVVIATAWDDPADDRKNIDWVRNTYAQVHARSRRGGYVNFLTADASEDESAGARAGIDLDRLARVRQRFDPDRIFFA